MSVDRLHFSDVVEWFVLGLHGRFPHPVGFLAAPSSPTPSASFSSGLQLLPCLCNMNLLQMRELFLFWTIHSSLDS